jgi:hypothetical protein
MARDIAGIARNSCPLCGELTQVPAVKVLFRRSNAFRCSACDGWIIAAERTTVMSGVGGLLGMAAGIWLYFQIIAWLQRTGSYPVKSTWFASFLVVLPVVLGLGAYVVCAIPFGRWNLQLEPALGARLRRSSGV